MLDDRSYMQSPEFRMRPAFPPVTIVLLVLNLGVFLFFEINKGYNGPGFLKLMETFALSREGLSQSHFWQLLTFQFLHADWLHCLFNLIFLYLFGHSVEASIGSKHTAFLYLGSGLVGGVAQAALSFAFPNVFGMAVVGASAGVMALLAAFATLDPNRELLMLGVLPIRSKYLLYFFGAVAAFFTIVPTSPGIAHAAHLGGLLAGAAYIRWIVQSPVSFSVPTMFRKRAMARGKKLPVKGYPPAEDDEELPPEEFISREVDPILEKISAHGLNSLTPREHRILEAARNKMAKR
jgi:membrane associated rhomboid family serine protease